eukprot:1768660-Rhodomonas_salina.2
MAQWAFVICVPFAAVRHAWVGSGFRLKGSVAQSAGCRLQGAGFSDQASRFRSQESRVEFKV